MQFKPCMICGPHGDFVWALAALGDAKSCKDMKHAPFVSILCDCQCCTMTHLILRERERVRVSLWIGNLAVVAHECARACATACVSHVLFAPCLCDFLHACSIQLFFFAGHRQTWSSVPRALAVPSEGFPWSRLSEEFVAGGGGA